jgi:putative pre-16S rRNA nuclease
MAASLSSFDNLPIEGKRQYLQSERVPPGAYAGALYWNWMPYAFKLAAKPDRRRVLAIDFGRKRMGLAVSDELQMTAQPLATLARSNRRNDVRRLREVVRVHAIGKIVVGNPVRLDGSEGEMAQEAARFAARIQIELRIPVELFDERLSSWEAQESAIAKRPKRRKQGAGIDAIAAAVILRDFLEREHTRKPTKK